MFAKLSHFSFPLIHQLVSLRSKMIIFLSSLQAILILTARANSYFQKSRNFFVSSLMTPPPPLQPVDFPFFTTLIPKPIMSVIHSLCKWTTRWRLLRAVLSYQIHAKCIFTRLNLQNFKKMILSRGYDHICLRFKTLEQRIQYILYDI